MPQKTTKTDPPRTKGQKKRAAIVAAAKEVVRERGVRALTTDAVATRLGLTQPAVYYYFRSRDALIASLAVEVAQREQEAMALALQEAADGKDGLARFVSSFVDFHLADLELFRVGYVWGQIVGISPDEVDAQVNPGIMGVFDTVEALLRSDQQAGLVGPDVPLRRVVASAYTSALGLVSLMSVCDSSGQRFFHEPRDMVSTIVNAAVAGAYETAA